MLNLAARLDHVVDVMHDSRITYDEAIRAFKRAFIVKVLKAHNGNQNRAAAELGMHRNTLSRTIAELNINARDLRRGKPRRPIIRIGRPATAPEDQVSLGA